MKSHLNFPHLFFLTSAFFIASSQSMWADDAKVDFARQIRPILSDRCFTCHGPDEEQRATDLRFDLRESTVEYAVEPGDPENSELLLRILSDDPDVVMPPPETKLNVTEEERQLIRQWIAEGAEYSQHWAFESLPASVEVPEVVDRWKAYVGDAIDSFVLRRLEGSGLSPSERADAETLIRRVTLDLTGLPPSKEEVERFKGDDSIEAYERVVDQLLKRETFGEHWAVPWLDAARYADTYGYQNDRYRAMWPWRDWVVGALNENLSYDKFVRWQLAGDLLPAPTQDQVLATAFNRNHRQTNEGGSVEEEFRAEYVADRVNTFGAAFLGLTLECCRCHDHKYDPISQENYYELSAFFNSIDESGLYSHFNESTPTPALSLASAQQLSQVKKLNEAALKSETALSKLIEKEASKQMQLTTSQLRDWLNERAVAIYHFDEKEGGKPVNAVTEEATGSLSENPKLVDGIRETGYLLSGENNISIPEGGELERYDSFSISLWVKIPEYAPRTVILHRSRAWTDAASRGYELILEDGQLSAALVHFWPGDAIRIKTRERLPLNRWVHIVATYDGSSRASGLRLYLDGHVAVCDTVRDKLKHQILGSSKVITLGQRFRDVGFKDGVIDELRVYDQVLPPIAVQELNLMDSGQEVASPEEVIDDPELWQVISPAIQTQLSKLREARMARDKLLDSIEKIMVMRELPSPRETYVLSRGAYDSPAQQVTRSVPEAIFPGEFSNTPSRLELADWLLDPQHPLTSRVAVNRMWQNLFGTGLVATSEDFGQQGSPPSHPLLLDFLARDFVESGWDVKRLIKRIVMSRTYQQSSNPTQENLESDPENVLLSRGPAFRLSAEMIRDAALSAGGLLVSKVGGPPVKPFQPEGLWKEKSGLTYKRDEGEGSHRRSVYTYWKRTSPPPSMMTFDATNREVCAVKRQTTMTPLQTLVLLNDPQYVEAAHGLARRACENEDSIDSQLHEIFRTVCAREPNASQLALLKRIYEEQLEMFTRVPANATALLEIGDIGVPEDKQIPHVAALTAVAQGLFSFDGFVMKR